MTMSKGEIKQRAVLRHLEPKEPSDDDIRLARDIMLRMRREIDLMRRPGCRHAPDGGSEDSDSEDLD